MSDAPNLDAELVEPWSRLDDVRYRWWGPTIGMLGLWPIAAVISILGFHEQWNSMPDAATVVLGNTLLAPFALAKAFGDTIGLTSPNSLRGLFVAVALFWPAVLMLAAAVVVKRSRVGFVVLTVLVGIASWKWLVVAAGMVGI